ncbi:DUF7619 domain-containing protein [Hymenobacter metallicola]|uniref:T9SS type A sorting domain-containing protein n=1 Tax=Hymenobacter metallicola TaxID=2563114 RepID=A0A4Z0QJ44_9BACT|nr:IPT/TIG domain-containing protein [Hymenobacter metallicola]TGE29011.1 T9SS type A sorting domain-containing protein [Hymenobacter metallicola]
MLKRLLTTILLVYSALGFAQNPTYRLDKMMCTPVDWPYDIAVDRAGNIYLKDGDVIKLDSTGRYLKTIDVKPTSGTNGGSWAMGLDAVGNLYVASYASNNSGGNNFVRKYNPDGQLLLQFGSAGTGPGQFQEVHGMCVNAAGTMFIADYSTARLQCFDNQGNRLFEYRVPGTPYSTHLVDVDLDAAGNIYLLEENFVVTKLSPSGQLLASIPLRRDNNTTWAPYDKSSSLLVEASGTLIVSGSQKPLMRFSAQGAFLSVVGTNAYVFSGSTRTALAHGRGGSFFATDNTHQTFSNHLYKYSSSHALIQRFGNLTGLSHVRQDEIGNVYTYDKTAQQVRIHNPAGQLILSFGLTGSTNLAVTGLALDGSGNIYVLETSDDGSRILKYTRRGQLLAKFESFGITQGYKRLSSLAVDAGGNMFVTDYYGGCVRKLSAQGAFLGTVGTWGIGSGQLFVPQAVAVDVRGNIYAADFDGRRVQKFSASGQLLKQFGPSTSYMGSTVCDFDMEVDGAGTIYLVSSVHAGKIFTADGRETPMPIGGSRVSINRSGSRLLVMSTNNDLIRFYVSGQQAPTNQISGQIFHDVNGNCIKEASELPLAGIVVVAEPGNYYGISDENGSYQLATDTGRYEVRQLLPENEVGRTIQQTCAANPTVVFRDYGNTVPGVDFGNQVSTSPFLRVGVASNRRRRCFRNTTTVTYANDGYAAASNVVVKVALPAEVKFISANAAHTVDADGNYVFQIGTVAANDKGSILIQDSVVCGNPELRGRTVCTKATIFPGNAYPPPPVWTRASVVAQGRPQAGNQVRFVLRNTGQGNMSDSLTFRIYQNSELALQHRYWLAATDSLVLRVPASRPVVRLEANQPAGHPTQRVASATVELRGLSNSGEPNPDMNSMFSGSPGPETATDCQPILDSYDPNDKLVEPTGVTQQHYTPTGTPLRYRIRFQNTGNDDAYRVVVVDTLAADLDPRTLRVESASHPYRFSVTGHGRLVLTFTLDNINLPPSSRNDAGSNGFVQFSIQPKAGLPARALVENNADIYFDYNPPIRTNTTVNRIYDLPLVVSSDVALSYSAIIASPAVTSLAPAQGRAGTLVTLTGQRFATTSPGNNVSFNGVSTPVLSATATTLTVRVPAGATSGAVQVVTPDGSARSQAFTVYQAPTLLSMTPAEGIPGSIVSLTGTHFAPLAAQDTVWFGPVAARVLTATATSLQVEVPAAPTRSLIKLSTLGGSVTSPQPFVIWYPPTLVQVSPAKARVGAKVTITGTNFAEATARNKVSFGAGPATVLQATAGTLQVQVPAAAESGLVRVETPGGTTTLPGFTLLPAPVLTTLNPPRGSVGSVVTVSGRNFQVDAQTDTVFFGGIPARVLSATGSELQVVVPKGVRTAPLTVAGAGGRSNSPLDFEVVALSPDEAIAAYPNPTSGELNINWSKAEFEVLELSLYDALGRVVYQQGNLAREPEHVQLRLMGYRPGMYLLRLQTSAGPVLKRISLL